jgi:hypothetical protein
VIALAARESSRTCDVGSPGQRRSLMDTAANGCQT